MGYFPGIFDFDHPGLMLDLRKETFMKARDVMVSPVVIVRDSDTVRDVAKLLIEKHVSAVPVVDISGHIVGIVSEADLIHRAETGTERPASWWLSLISGERALAEEYSKSHAKGVRDVMTKKVQTAHPDTPLHEIADMLEEARIKRVPIVNQAGELVGIVSRANIVQAFASARPRLEMSAPDALIRERLIAELKKYSWSHLHKLNVTVTNGVVDLWGIAESDPERQAIRVAAESVPGVMAVNDHLVQEPIYLY
jgi:CBS domain-containing protein